MTDQFNRPLKTVPLKQFKSLQKILKYTFVVLPIVAGLDKFFNLLVNWEIYVPGWIGSIIPPEALMIIAGIIEIIAGLIVLVKTEIGAYIVALWLALIVLVLITGGQFLDVAVRDIVMAISAFVLARMTNLLKTEQV